jgi:hypothetical protein
MDLDRPGGETSSLFCHAYVSHMVIRDHTEYHEAMSVLAHAEQQYHF